MEVTYEPHNRKTCSGFRRLIPARFSCGLSLENIPWIRVPGFRPSGP